MVTSCLMKAPMVWILLLGVFSGARGAPAAFYLEAEQGEGFQPDNAHTRANARDGLAVWLRGEERLTFTFCLTADDNMTVMEVRFSSDGYEKEGAVLVDGTEVSGTF